jgi:hypothetical protein
MAKEIRKEKKKKTGCCLLAISLHFFYNERPEYQSGHIRYA